MARITTIKCNCGIWKLLPVLKPNKIKSLVSFSLSLSFIWVYTHTGYSRAIRTFICIYVCVCTFTLHIPMQKQLKNILYIAALRHSFASLRFGLVWFTFVLFCFCFCFVFVRFGLGFWFSVSYRLCLSSCLQRERGARAALFTTPQLPPPFVIELIPATSLVWHCDCSEHY